MEKDFSNDAMMRQAEQVWSMLDDLADSDPTAYKSFIDKQMSERKEFMAPPEASMCVQTQMMKPKNVPFFINFCSWKRIPPPANAEEPVKVAGSMVGQIDEEKGSPAVTAVAFNEKILNECGKNPNSIEDQDTLIQIAMDFIEKQHPHIRLNRKYKVLERSYKGNLKMIQESLFQAFQTKESNNSKEFENVMKRFAPSTAESPDILLQQLRNQGDGSDVQTDSNIISDKILGINLSTKPAEKGLIEEVSNTDIPLPEPQYDLRIIQSELGTTKCFSLKVYLPGVKSVAECELDISKEDVVLDVEGKYKLKLTLPSQIVCSEAKAKFVKKSAVLEVNMPID